MHVPHRFARKLRLHLVMNVVMPPGVTVPLLFGIHGRPGEGKTAMTRRVFAEMGVLPIPVFADAFESVEAGEPAKELRRRYLRASEVNAEIAAGRSQHQLAVLTVDDLDQRIASDPTIDVQQTQNTALLNAALMELADSPESVDGVRAIRTPIVVTANHFDWLYRPLTRTGRLTAFHWAPEPAERFEIVAAIFPELLPDEVSSLVEEFEDRPISDFAATRNELFEAAVDQALDGVEPSGILAAARDDAWRRHLRAPEVTADRVSRAMLGLQGNRVVA